MTTQAGCLCGQLTVSVEQAPVFSCYCHCHACQARSSAPCTGFVMVKQSATNIRGKLQTYNDQGGSGQPIVQHRCTDCGSTVFSELKVLEDIIAIPSARLVDASFFQPEAHVWVSSKDPRFEITDDVTQQAGPPKALFPYIAKPAQG